ncbi:MAG: M20/M25/M40 family metallo-hydrolase, partial [Thermoanaerobaculia bacterium]|nr:M20/M25/M40 family metallo-hydrolase [Thermoanaerobaculia bacterium]
RLERYPLPAHLGGPMEGFSTISAPTMPLAARAVFANLWLTRPLVVRQLEATAKTNALIRTTTAPTMLEASPKDNVLPTRARAVVNFRIHPQDSVAATLAKVREIIADPRVEVNVYGTPSEPSAVSPIGDRLFELLQTTLGQVFPEALVAPSLVIGATDSRHYAGLTERIYRFTPVRLGEGDFERFHGLDERLATSSYEECIRFYAQLLRNV